MIKTFLKIFAVVCIGISIVMVGVACKKRPRVDDKNSDATLSALSVTADGATESALLWPDFDPPTLEYVVAMPKGTEKIHIAATPAKSTSTVRSTDVGDKDVSVGSLKFYIRVTAQNNSYNIYSITVTVPPESPDADPTLDSLSINSNKAHLSPEFNSAWGNYVATIPAGLTQVSIEASATVPGAVIVISGATGNIVPVSEGSNEIFVTVTALDTVTTKTYKLTIIVPKSNSDASLKTLTVKVGQTNYSLTPAFVPGIPANQSGYTVLVPSGTTSVFVAASATQGSSAVTGDIGVKTLKVLDGKENTFTVKVTAQDKTVQTYTIKVIVTPYNTDATLSLLGVSGGTLSPAFNPNTDEYSVTMPKGTVYVVVLATLTKPTSKIISGTSTPHGVTKGKNKPIEIKVEAEAGNIKVYKITVTVKETVFNGIYNIESMTFGSQTFTAGDFDIDIENEMITFKPSGTGGDNFTIAVASFCSTRQTRDTFLENLAESMANAFEDFILPVLLYFEEYGTDGVIVGEFIEILEETLEDCFQAVQHFYPETVLDFLLKSTNGLSTIPIDAIIAANNPAAVKEAFNNAIAEAKTRISDFIENLTSSQEDSLIDSIIESMIFQMFLQGTIEPVNTAPALGLDEETGEFYWDYGWARFVVFKWYESTDKVTSTLEVIPGWNIVCTFVKTVV